MIKWYKDNIFQSLEAQNYHPTTKTHKRFIHIHVSGYLQIQIPQVQVNMCDFQHISEGRNIIFLFMSGYRDMWYLHLAWQ